MNTETTEDYSWVPLIDEKTISITYLNIKMQSERWSNINIKIFQAQDTDTTHFLKHVWSFKWGICVLYDHAFRSTLNLYLSVKL